MDKHQHLVNDTDVCFKIDTITRNISSVSGKSALIQGDHNSERFTFELSTRKIEDHDMSLCNVVQIHYINIDSETKEKNVGVYEVDDLKISEDDENVVVLSWLISSNATQFAGSLNFIIKFKCVADDGSVDYVWNTEVYKGIRISDGIDNGDDVVENYSDILELWRRELVEAGDALREEIESTLKNGEFKGEDGKTPVKGKDYWTEADKQEIVAQVTPYAVTEEMIQQVIATLATPVFGRVDENNNIILSGELVNGTYTLKYENVDGNLVIIGKLTQNGSTGDEIIIPTWTYGEKIENDGTITTTGVGQYCYSDFIEFEQNTRIHLYCSNKNGLHCKLFYYAENEDTGEKTFLSAVDWVINDNLDGEKEITIDETSYTGATCVRLRCNVLTAGEWEKLDRLTVTRVNV